MAEGSDEKPSDIDGTTAAKDLGYRTSGLAPRPTVVSTKQ